MYLLYACLSLVVFVLISPYLAWQALRHHKYVVNLRQRLGYLPVSFNVDGEDSIWVHAVSVGEALAVRSIAGELKARYPGLRLFVSTTTIAGQQVASRDMKQADATFYFPIDLAFIVRRTLRLVRPRLFIAVETEIWPILLRECRRNGVRTMIVNGRISNRSYPRYRLVRPFIRRVLDHLDLACMQSGESARRLVDLGADRRRVRVTGNLKYDSSRVSPVGAERGGPRVLRYFRIREERPVIVAGSTMRGEDVPVLRAFTRVRTAEGRPLLVIAPRHPERFDEVERLAREEGLRVTRRTALDIDADPPADVVVLDTIGELAQLYRIATVVFVGGSLVPTGGHNILEPAAFGKPILFGPHMQNFKEIADAFLVAGAALQVGSPGELEEVLGELLADSSRRARLGAAARAIVDANQGALEKTLQAIAEVLPPAEVVKVKPFRLPRRG
jgi:3-deoxy-D-manno-octulosonic-acid transferase